MARISRIVTAVSVVALLAPAALAEGDPEASPLVAACDAQAANPYNAANPAGLNGKVWDALDAAAARTACEPAVAAFPDHLRTVYHLGRANHKLGDEAEAERLYLKAADQDYEMAVSGLLTLYSESEAPDADAKARALLDSCVAAQMLVCQTKLAEWLVTGDGGVEPDPARAIGLFEAAAAKGDSGAQSYAGWMYDEGVGVTEDDARAVTFYLPAAGAGDFFAQNNLAVHYERGEGVAQDDALALYWYEKAAAQGDAEDQYIVGGYYLKGIGTEKDFYKAAEYFRRASEQGFAKATAELEQMIADGLVVPGPAD